MFNKINKRIFLDYASTTPVDQDVLKEMKKYFSSSFANCQSIHQEGLKNKKVLEESRKKVARLVQVKDNEIIFTGGGTESNNLAILGLVNFAKKNKISKPHIITTNIEHVAVLEVCNYLEKNDIEVTYLKANEKGLINSGEIINEIKDNTVLISVMLANNEVGTILPIRDISRKVSKYKKENGLSKKDYPFVHTDASQAPNYLDINVDQLGVDLMSLDGSKIYGPKGVGCLIRKDYINLEKISFGGGQEFGLRAGTENLPLIVGFQVALEKAFQNKDKESKRLQKLQNYFFEEIREKIPQATINGSIKKRLPNNINICIPNLNAEFTVIQLDEMGVACASMTACRNLTELSSSYVVESINPECAKSSLRFSMGKDTVRKDIDRTIQFLAKVIK